MQCGKETENFWEAHFDQLIKEEMQSNKSVWIEVANEILREYLSKINPDGETLILGFDLKTNKKYDHISHWRVDDLLDSLERGNPPWYFVTQDIYGLFAGDNVAARPVFVENFSEGICKNSLCINYKFRDASIKGDRYKKSLLVCVNTWNC